MHKEVFGSPIFFFKLDNDVIPRPELANCQKQLSVSIKLSLALKHPLGNVSKFWVFTAFKLKVSGPVYTAGQWKTPIP